MEMGTGTGTGTETEILGTWILRREHLPLRLSWGGDMLGGQWKSENGIDLRNELSGSGSKNCD